MFGANQGINGAVSMPLTPQPTWYRVASRADYTFFAFAGLSVSIPLFALPGRGIIHGIKIKHDQSFTGGGITAYTLSVGVLGSLAKYASAFDVFQTVSSQTYQLSSNFSGEDEVVDTQLYATATSVTANLNAASQGIVNIWALLASSTR
jgi:SNF family Na+-dependent transporter